MAAKEELIIGLQNAIDRGENIETAIQTLISAGYNAQDVQEASRYVNQGVLGAMPPATLKPVQREEEKLQEAESEKPAETKETQVIYSQPAKEAEEKPKKKVKVWLIILLAIIFLVLLGIMGIVFFGQAILKSSFSP